MRRLRPIRRRARERAERDYHAPDSPLDSESVLPNEDSSFDEFVPVERAAASEYEAADLDDAVPYDGAPFDGPESPSPQDDAAADGYMVDDDALFPPEGEAPVRRRLGLRRPRIGGGRARGPRVATGWLLAALGLIVAGVFFTLLRQDRISGEAAELWPLAGLGVAGIWLLLALVRRRVASFLGAAGFAGISLAALLDTQDIAAIEETLMGVMLILLGLGIVVRGFLLRQQLPR